jgi:hypothetical protein
MKLDLAERYCLNYCEENVWHLAGDCVAAGADARVVFISNDDRAVATWHQRAAAAGEPILWDYHVILFVRTEAKWCVHDADSRLPDGSQVAAYIEATFPLLPSELAQHAPDFRVIESSLYHAQLRSDRSHMQLAGGRWASPPPPRPPIGVGTNLMCFVDMRSDFQGEVMGRGALLEAFGG